VPHDFLSYLASVQRFGIRPGLERIRELLLRAQVLDAEGQTSFPVVLIGGTNGKGSTAQFLAQMLAGSSHRVGLYTSPHLHSWNERIRIVSPSNSGEPSGGLIEDAELEALFQSTLPLLDEVAQSEHGQPTEFEVLTLLGLLHFARQNVDAAVVEVGLGGKWDATNVLYPLVSVVTHVALDHCDRLGSTLEAIAADKIHIARPERVLVTAEQKPQVLEVFREHCTRIGARLCAWQAKTALQCEERAKCAKEQARVLPPEMPEFQKLNWQTARVAHLAFAHAASWPKSLSPTRLRRSNQSAPRGRVSSIVSIVAAAWRADAEAFLAATATPQVAGRLELVRREPTVILDGANNPDGAQVLARELKRLKEQNPGAKLHLIFGASSDKDALGMLQVLAPLADRLTLSQASHSRAAAVGELASMARECEASVDEAADVNRALERALAEARAQDIVCVCGSFFLLGDVDRARLALHSRQGVARR